MNRPQPQLVAAPFRRAAMSVVAAQAALFGILAAFVWHAARPGRFDIWALEAASADGSHSAAQLAEHLTFLGSPAVVGVLAVILAAAAWWRWRSPVLSVLAVAAPAVAGVVEVVLKPMVARPRPLLAAAAGEHGFSFPSGHATGAAAVATIAAILLFAVTRHRPTRVLGVLAAAAYAGIVSWSRVVIEVHYTTDVIAGAVLGAAIATALAIGTDQAATFLRTRGRCPAGSPHA